MIPWERIDQLSHRATDLKLARDYVGMLPLREEIAHILEVSGADAEHVANALNYLAALNLRLKRYTNAESYARRSVSYYEERGGKSRENLATYIQLLAWVLVFQGRLDEAIPLAERAITEYSVFHSPDDHFLTQRKVELEDLRNGIVTLQFDF